MIDGSFVVVVRDDYAELPFTILYFGAVAADWLFDVGDAEEGASQCRDTYRSSRGLDARRRPSAATCIADRQNEVENRPAWNRCRYPKTTPMGLDNRSADRQTHPHPGRFGREESVKNPAHILSVDADPGIVHRDQHIVG